MQTYANLHPSIQQLNIGQNKSDEVPNVAGNRAPPPPVVAQTALARPRMPARRDSLSIDVSSFRDSQVPLGDDEEKMVKTEWDAPDTSPRALFMTFGGRDLEKQTRVLDEETGCRSLP